MATNKNKDAAALFELIDRSTLKVPKNAGALRIPSWWSSKNNPPTEPAHAAPTPTAHAPAPTPPANLPTNNVEAKSPAEPTAPAAPAQPEATAIAPPPLPPTPPAPSEAPSLFTPPAAAPTIAPPPADTAEAPSIRPPAKPPVTPTPAPAVAAAKPRVSPPGVYVPNTLDPAKASRRFTGSSAAQMASAAGHAPMAHREPLPMWVLLAGAALVVMIIAIIMFLVLPGRQRGTPTTGAANNNGALINATDLNPRLDLRGTNNGNAATQNRVVPPPPPPPPPPTKARAYEPGQVVRKKELIYLVIHSDRNLDNARKNAQFIAERGVDVSVERSSNGIFMIMSVQGFPARNEEAEALRKRVIAIGKETVDFKRSGKTWTDAYFGRDRNAQ